MTIRPTLAGSHPQSDRDFSPAVSRELVAAQATMAFTQALVTVLALLAGTLPLKLKKNSVLKKVSTALDLPCDRKVGAEGGRTRPRLESGTPSGVGGPRLEKVYLTVLGRFHSPFQDWRHWPWPSPCLRSQFWAHHPSPTIPSPLYLLILGFPLLFSKTWGPF